MWRMYWGTAAGDEVVIMGRSGDDEISAEEIAGKIGTTQLWDSVISAWDYKIYIDTEDGNENAAN